MGRRNCYEVTVDGYEDQPVYAQDLNGARDAFMANLPPALADSTWDDLHMEVVLYCLKTGERLVRS